MLTSVFYYYLTVTPSFIWRGKKSVFQDIDGCNQCKISIEQLKPVCYVSFLQATMICSILLFKIQFESILSYLLLPSVESCKFYASVF